MRLRSIICKASPGGLAGLLWLMAPGWLLAADEQAVFSVDSIDIRGLLQAGGAIGYLILALSVAMVALIVEHLLSIRRSSLMPTGLADEVHSLISHGHLQQAEQLCRQHPSFLGFVVSAGLQEASLGYNAIEKAIEDASAEQSARLFRKIEYLSVIGTLAPMLGLMGTVWGMIQAFGEFAVKANPQVAEFAPGISRALVTTLMGLAVAVPALAAFAIFRNRIDEFVAETSLLAEHVVSPIKRNLKEKRRTAKETRSSNSTTERPQIPPIVKEKGEAS